MLDILGGIFLMVRRSLRQHALSSAVTITSVALACGLLMSVFVIRTQTQNAFTSGATGFDAVLGARGSQLQLVLNSVFHLETSPGNIPYSMYLEVRDDKGRWPQVKAAIPFAVGDNYRGYRIVGTVPQYFDEASFAGGRKLQVQQGGRLFSPDAAEAVVGSLVAQQTGLRVGSVFNSYHNLEFSEEMKHDDEFVVVGVLEPTNTPIDRVIWIPIDGYYHMSGHGPVDKATGRPIAIDQRQPIPDKYKEVSAVMLKLRNPALDGMALDYRVNRQGNSATLAFPIGKIMADLFYKIAWANQVLEYVAYLVAVVAGASILASIYNTMNERRREFAILRALGASRATVFSAIVAESATIAALGAAAAYAVYAALIAVAAYFVRMKAGVVIDTLAWHPALGLTPLAMIALGAVAGVVPAWKAYATDVATNLLPAS